MLPLTRNGNRRMELKKATMEFHWTAKQVLRKEAIKRQRSKYRLKVRSIIN